MKLIKITFDTIQFAICQKSKMERNRKTYFFRLLLAKLMHNWVSSHVLQQTRFHVANSQEKKVQVRLN